MSEHCILDTGFGVKISAWRVLIGIDRLTAILTRGFITSTVSIGNSESIDWGAGDFWRNKLSLQRFPLLLDSSDQPNVFLGTFLHYLEASWQLDEAAWDPRAAWATAQSRAREDYVFNVVAALKGEKPEAIPEGLQPRQQLSLQLGRLASAIDGFEKLLDDNREGHESLFHDYLREHPMLLEAYGTPVSKPRWRFPADSASGKGYVEPDFVFKSVGPRYKMIELERPGKALATAGGEPRAAVNQAAYQIAEWRNYIAQHYDLIKGDFETSR